MWSSLSQTGLRRSGRKQSSRAVMETPHPQCTVWSGLVESAPVLHLGWFGAASTGFLLMDHGLSENGSLNICDLFLFCSFIPSYKVSKKQPRS